MAWLELVAVVSGIASVYLTARQSLWCWPTGILSTALFAGLFFAGRLYSDAALQLVYVLLGLYGWHAWRHGGAGHSPLSVSFAPAGVRLGLLALAVGASLALGAGLDRLTDTDVPYWDALTTVLSLIAQLMLTRKWIENWGVWILVNLVYLGLYAFKGLYLTSAQQIVYVGLSVMGLREWLRAPRVPIPRLELDAPGA